MLSSKKTFEYKERNGGHYIEKADYGRIATIESDYSVEMNSCNLTVGQLKELVAFIKVLTKGKK